MISIRKMESSEVNRLSEIDRTEDILQDYQLIHGTLEAMDVNWHIAPWDIEEKIKEWIPIAEGYRNMWGAFDEEKRVGFAVFNWNRTIST